MKKEVKIINLQNKISDIEIFLPKNFGEIQECFKDEENNKIGRGDLI